MQVLVITDEIRVSSITQRGLTQSGFSVDVVGDKVAGLEKAGKSLYDLVIVDNEIGNFDGSLLVGAIRTKLPEVKIILLLPTVIDDEKKIPEKYGVEEILIKPFSPTELRRKILSLTGKKGPATILTADDLVLHSLKKRVVRGTKEITLSEKEFEILEYLLICKERILSRDDILEFVWDYHFESVSNLVDMFIAHLRTKIDLPAEHKLIQTYPKKGYMISEEKGLFG